jgi:hypothetical protein
MKRMLIAATLLLVILAFARGSEGRVLQEEPAIAELNHALDARLGTRLTGLAVAAQLSAWLND